jgi:hydrogenase maturation factor
MSAHPELGPRCSVDDHCVTCADEGVPVRVLRIDLNRMLALCRDADDRTSTIDIGIVEDIAVGDELLVHAGVALTRLERGRVE